MNWAKMKNLLEIKDLSVTFNIKPKPVRAVNKISLDMQKGEIIGIVGESGSGKSVTALTIMGLLNNNRDVSISGEVIFDNQNLLRMKQRDIEKLRGSKIAMIFQDPVESLNPVMKIGKQVAEVYSIHEKLDSKTAWEKALRQLAKVRIRDPLAVAEQYPHQLSGGMCQRVMIAIALAADPMLLIADEPTTDLDVTIQAQILLLLKSLYHETNTSLIIITHDLGVVCQFCKRIAVMLNGNIVETAEVEELFNNPKHPYTKGLLNSIPVIGSKARLQPMPGEDGDSDAGNLCPFYNRCVVRTGRCDHERPSLDKISRGHLAACFSGRE